MIKRKEPKSGEAESSSYLHKTKGEYQKCKLL
jgi:hypothetical protein